PARLMMIDRCVNYNEDYLSEIWEGIMKSYNFRNLEHIPTSEFKFTKKSVALTNAFYLFYTETSRIISDCVEIGKVLLNNDRENDVKNQFSIGYLSARLRALMEFILLIYPVVNEESQIDLDEVI